MATANSRRLPASIGSWGNSEISVWQSTQGMLILAVNRVFVDFAVNLNVEGLTGWQLDVAQADTARLTVVTTEAVAVVEALIGFLGCLFSCFLRSSNRCSIGRE